MTRPRPMFLAVPGVLALALGACSGSEDAATGGTDGATADGAAAVDEDAPRVVATTAILGNIATQILDGTGAEVTVVMPPGVDPHAYEASASDGVALREADLVIANGLNLEEGLLDILEAAEGDGATVIEVADDVDPLPVGDGEGHAEDEGHAHGAEDPHVWLDPVRVGEIGRLVADAYAGVDPDAAETVEQNATAYADTMATLDADLQDLVATLGDDQRQLVTNHESLGYLAARYGLEVIDTVLPGTTTDVDVTAEAFSELVTTIREAGVAAIFADTSSSDRLAQALATEVGDVEVVELFTESLGEPGSGADGVEGMIRTNIERIVEALG